MVLLVKDGTLSKCFSCAENKVFSVKVYKSGSKLKLNVTTFRQRPALLTWIAYMAEKRNGKLCINDKIGMKKAVTLI